MKSDSTVSKSRRYCFSLWMSLWMMLDELVSQVHGRAIYAHVLLAADFTGGQCLKKFFRDSSRPLILWSQI